MFEAWGRILYRRRRLTLVLALAFAVFAGLWGTGVFSKLNSGNSFTPPGSQSQQEQDLANQTFGRNDADVVVLYHSATRTVADPAYQQAVISALAQLPRQDVANTITYWQTKLPDLVSTDRHSTYAVVHLTGKDDAARQKAYKAIKNDFTPAVLGQNDRGARHTREHHRTRPVSATDRRRTRCHQGSGDRAGGRHDADRRRLHARHHFVAGPAHRRPDP